MGTSLVTKNQEATAERPTVIPVRDSEGLDQCGDGGRRGVYLEEWSGRAGTMSREPGEVGLRAEQEAPSLVAQENKCTHGDAGYRGVGRTVEFHSLVY